MILPFLSFDFLHGITAIIIVLMFCYSLSFPVQNGPLMFGGRNGERLLDTSTWLLIFLHSSLGFGILQRVLRLKRRSLLSTNS